MHSDADFHGSPPRRVGTRPNCGNIAIEATPYIPVAYSIVLTYLRDGNIRSVCLRTSWLTMSSALATPRVLSAPQFDPAALDEALARTRAADASLRARLEQIVAAAEILLTGLPE